METQRFYVEKQSGKKYLCSAAFSGFAVMTPVDGGEAFMIGHDEFFKYEMTTVQ